MRTDPIRSGVARVGGGHEFFDEGRVFRMELGGNGLCGVEGAGVWFFHDFPDG